jgi:molybdopterin synthase sulfurtransferase
VSPSPLSLFDLPRARHLVSPQALARLLAQDGSVRLVEVGCDGGACFASAHIPGAAWLDTASLEQAPLFNKVPDSALLAVLLALGIGHDSTVVLYGRSSLPAARAAHLMLYAGVTDVRLLDGGFAAWRGACLPCESGQARATAPRASFGAPFPACPHYLADTGATARMLGAQDAAVVSVRTWSEYIGATSGYSYIDARGDIPGARWGRAGREGDVNSMSEYQQADGRMRPAAEIARMWAANGIGPEQQAVFYCGTGWRASLAFYYAWLMGWRRIAVYDGGWYEWSSDPANPVVCRVNEARQA